MSVKIGNYSSRIVDDGLVLHLDPSNPKNYVLNEVEVLVVGGGGGGSYNVYDDGSGGGGGGVRYSSFYKVTPGSGITATVGNGGASGNTIGNKGQNSVFGSIIAEGGGSGMGHRASQNSSGYGGSGGGSGGQYSGSDNNRPGDGKPGQGHPGGHSTAYGGGGGGGAGSPGQGCRSSQVGGNGGDGLAFDISGKLKYYAGGGGGYPKTTYQGFGGKGGGGDTYVAGVTNTGGGGGGGKASSPSLPTGAPGGKGVVIVRYPGARKANGGDVIETISGYTIHTFNNSGTFTPLSAPTNASTIYGLQDFSGYGNRIEVANSGSGVTYESESQGVIDLDGASTTRIYAGISEKLRKEFTYLFWFKFDQGTRTAGSGRKDFLYGDYTQPANDTSRPHFTFDREGDGKLGNYLVKNGSGNDTVKSSTTTWNNNQWYMATFTGAATRDRVYIDGTLETEVSLSGEYANWSRFTFGLPGANSFPGRIGVVLFYDRELTSSEIQQNYNATKGRYGH